MAVGLGVGEGEAVALALADGVGVEIAGPEVELLLQPPRAKSKQAVTLTAPARPRFMQSLPAIASPSGYCA